ncbi:MAG TPA: UDP-N-acetylmuramoyl-L-alanyl-D-glutamate--2,6-diaminopimelate ligase, partial [Dehalococcoidia bacterium]|nr:UDP-N-acetylmuramoyl-L-alanyl-D-glutamate--2,6-diaminopimelate ligase [Dehalococcoidia bacterium]
MLLAALLAQAGLAPFGDADAAVTGVVYDSRRVQVGNLFVAIQGFHVDGARFVPDALARGACAAVVNEGALEAVELAFRPRCLAVPDTRRALSALAAAWYGRPAEKLVTIGVTGTDGKTTTSYLTCAVLNGCGMPAGLFTTVAYKAGERWEDNESRQTTPEAPEVQELLRRMLDAGDRYAVLESTSHGLELHKLDDCEYDLAVFTNLSPDHLDFHGTVDAYRRAKGRLFAMLDESRSKGVEKVAIVNADDENSAYMASRCRARKLWYGIDRAADVRAGEIALGPDGSSFVVTAGGRQAAFKLRLPGRFNVSNALAATAVGLSLGATLEGCAEALARWEGVPGRMQRIEAGQPFTVVVDYAHTGASFRKALETLRPLTNGRLITVFGCAGERGVERRTGMGEVAAAHADYTVLTTEDPRSEDPERIIAQIADAMTAAGAVEGRSFERIPDRRAAIARAFSLARPGDLVLLAG